MADFPPVPLTLEGSFLLHQFFRFDWKAWRACADGERKSIAAEATCRAQPTGTLERSRRTRSGQRSSPSSATRAT